MRPKRSRTKFAVVALCALPLLLAACGGRHANPVSAVSVTDQYMSCPELQATMVSNDTRMASLRDEERRAKAGNVALGVVGAVLFWPALFALDTTNTEQVEINAFQSRNAYLTALVAQRCSAPSAVLPAGATNIPAQAAQQRTAPPASTDEFVRCQLNSGTVAMLTHRECNTWGGRLV
jgi:hypothetical protein